jgi:serine/threonine protein kinase
MNALVLSSMGAGEEWPEEAEDAYGRVEVLGRGSYGLVWMARRAKPVKGQDEYVAIKNIHIKDEKSRIYARREISILSELKHPNIVGFIHEYPVHKASQLVVLQLARGPNLQSLVSKRGALGIPLSRLVSRHLIAAVSYMREYIHLLHATNRNGACDLPI